MPCDGEPLPPGRRRLRGELVDASCPAARASSSFTHGRKSAGARSGKVSSEVAHVALRVEDQRRDAREQRLLEQHDREPGLAGARHADDHAVRGEVARSRRRAVRPGCRSGIERRSRGAAHPRSAMPRVYGRRDRPRIAAMIEQLAGGAGDEAEASRAATRATRSGSATRRRRKARLRRGAASGSRCSSSGCTPRARTASCSSSRGSTRRARTASSGRSSRAQPAGLPRRLVQGADRRPSSRTTTSGASTPRSRPAARSGSSTARTTRTSSRCACSSLAPEEVLDAPAGPHPRVGADAHRRGHDDREGVPQRLEGGAAHAAPGAHRRPGEAVEVPTRATSRCASASTTSSPPTSDVIDRRPRPSGRRGTSSPPTATGSRALAVGRAAARRARADRPAAPRPHAWDRGAAGRVSPLLRPGPPTHTARPRRGGRGSGDRRARAPRSRPTDLRCDG